MTNYLKVFLKVFEAREEFFPANPSREYGLNSTKRNENPTDLRRKMHKYKNIFRVNFEILKKFWLAFSFFLPIHVLKLRVVWRNWVRQRVYMHRASKLAGNEFLQDALY